MSDRLDQIHIPTPCAVPWDSMSGDDKVRHCAQCNCKVYDLSALPAIESEQLLERAAASLCVQIVRRTDGSVVTADAPMNASPPNRRRFGRWLLFSVSSALGLAGCEREDTHVRLGGSITPAPAPTRGSGGKVAPQGGEEKPRILRGEVAPEPLRGKVVAPPKVCSGDFEQPKKQ